MSKKGDVPGRATRTIVFSSTHSHYASAAIGSDGALYHTDHYYSIIKREPGEVTPHLYVGGSSYRGEETTAHGPIDTVAISNAINLHIPYRSDTLYFVDGNHVNLVINEKVKSIASTPGGQRPFVFWTYANGSTWAATNIFMRTNPKSSTLYPFTSVKCAPGAEQTGALAFALLPGSVPATSPRSGAIYLASNTFGSVIRRIWNGFVQHVAGAELGADSRRTGIHHNRNFLSVAVAHSKDGPLAQARFDTIEGLIINSQEDILVSSSSMIRMIRSGQVTSIHQSYFGLDYALHSPLNSCSPYSGIYYNTNTMFIPIESIYQALIERPWNRIPATTSFEQFTSLIEEYQPMNPPYDPKIRRRRDSTDLEYLYLSVDPRLDPKKIFNIYNAKTGKTWQLHRDVISLRCPSLLKDEFQHAFAQLQERQQASLLEFIFSDKLPYVTTIADDAELDIACRKCNMMPLSEYLRHRIAMTAKRTDTPLFQSLVEVLQRIPDDMSDDYVDLIALELRQQPSLLQGKFEELKALSPNPSRAASIIAKLVGAPAASSSASSPPLDNPMGKLSSLLPPLLPWIPNNERFKSEGVPVATVSSKRLARARTVHTTPKPISKPNPIKELKLVKPAIPPDFSISCRGILFPCHKWILLARWSYFRDELTKILHQTGKVPDLLVIDTVTAEFMEALLIWFYCSDNNIFSSVEQCTTFILQGSSLGLVKGDRTAVHGMKTLLDFVKNGAISDLHVSTVVQQLRVSQIIDDEASISRCVTFIAGRLGEILANADNLQTWISIGAPLLLQCFSQSFLSQSNSSHNVNSRDGGPFFVETVAGSGLPGFSNGASLTSTFNRPSGICVSSNGEIFVSDTGNHVIRAVRAGGSTRTAAGSGNEGYKFGKFENAEFATPFGIHISEDGEVYVADHDNDRIRVLKQGLGEVKTFCGTGRTSVLPSTDFSSNPKPLKSSQVTLPTGFCFQGSRMFISQSARHCILEASSGMVSIYAGHTTPLASADGLKKDSMIPFDIWRGYVDGPRIQSRFDSPHGLCIAPNRDLIVADSGNHCIRLVTATMVTTYAGVGQSNGFLDGKLPQSLFHYPTDVAIHGDRLYVSDSANHRIRMVYKGEVTTVCGNGAGGFVDGFSGGSQFYFPSALCVGQDGEIYVADTANHAIRVVRQLHTQKSEPDASPSNPEAQETRPVDVNHYRFPPLVEMLRVQDEIDVKWTHRSSDTTVGLHSLVLKLRLPHLLEDGSNDLSNLLINNNVSSAAFKAFIEFIYSDSLPVLFDRKIFSEVIYLFSLAGDHSFMKHSQMALYKMIDSLNESETIMTILKILLAHQAPIELLDMIVPKLRENPSYLSSNIASDPGMPSSILDVISKVADPKAPVTKIPTSSPLLEHPLNSLISSLLPQHPCLPTRMSSSIESATGPEPESLNRNPLLANIAGDTLVTFGGYSTVCHSLILKTRWPHTRHWIQQLSSNFAQAGLPPSVINQIVLPDAPPELISAILVHIYTGLPLDLGDYKFQMGRFDEILCLPTSNPVDTSDWTLMGSIIPITLENCVERLLNAITSGSSMEEEQARIFIRQRLGFLWNHPTLHSSFINRMPPPLVASLLMENYAQLWPMEELTPR